MERKTGLLVVLWVAIFPLYRADNLGKFEEYIFVSMFCLFSPHARAIFRDTPDFVGADRDKKGLCRLCVARLYFPILWRQLKTSGWEIRRGGWRLMVCFGMCSKNGVRIFFEKLRGFIQMIEFMQGIHLITWIFILSQIFLKGFYYILFQLTYYWLRKSNGFITYSIFSSKFLFNCLCGSSSDSLVGNLVFEAEDAGMDLLSS